MSNKPMNKKVIITIVLIAWVIFALWAGTEIGVTYREAIGALFPFYLMVWTGLIFLGRFILEMVLVFFFWS